MRPIARVGDIVLCKCGPSKIVTGSKTYLVDGRPVARLGDKHSKGVIISGSKTLLVDGRPAARVGDKAICFCKKFVHIGKICRGSTTQLVG